MGRSSVLFLLGILIVLLVSFAGALSFTVSTESEWTQGSLDNVTVRNDTLELNTPLEIEGFETEVALDYWDIYRGDAFVPESGFTGNDAIALHKSTSVPGVGNITQLNYTIPRGFIFEEGAQFSAWTKHNGSESSNYRVTYRLEGPSGLATASVDEKQEEITCGTDQGGQTIDTDASVDSWYQFVFRIYPQDSMVYCEIRDNNDTTIGAVNLSATMDFSRVVIRGNGDASPWAWFDDVTIPKYLTEGAYSQHIDNEEIQDWLRIQVDVANITADSDVDAVFEAQDSSGTTVRSQMIDLVNGQQSYNLTVLPSQDATITFNGTTTDPSTSWSISSYTIYSNTTNVSAPSIDQATVSTSTATVGDTLTLSAELTDDDNEQNTVRLWTRENGSLTWEQRNTTVITPLTADTVVSFDYTFTSNGVGDHQFKFNTTDASGYTAQTSSTLFTIIEKTDTNTNTTMPREKEENTTAIEGSPSRNHTKTSQSSDQNEKTTSENTDTGDSGEDGEVSDIFEIPETIDTGDELFDERTVKMLVSAVLFLLLLIFGYYTYR